jgi:hypothetical protein
MTTPRSKTAAIAAAVEGMKSKLCGWPLCECRHTHDRLTREAIAMADESQPCPTQAEWDALFVAATVNLAGISQCCADRCDRYLATMMLLKPTYSEARFDAALQRLCADYDAAEAAEPDPEPEPAPPPSYHGPDVDPALTDYGPMFLGTAGRETLLQRKARHHAIDRQRRATLEVVPTPKKGTVSTAEQNQATGAE